MEYDPELLREEDSRNFERIAAIKESVQQLISALQIERDPEIERTILTLSHETSDTSAVWPDFIIRNFQLDTSIAEVWVDITVNRLTDTGDFGLYATGISTDGTMVALGVTTGDHSDQTICTAVVIGEDDMPVVEPVSAVEINRYLASLLTRSKTGDYSAFDKMDLHQAETLERLVEAVTPAASEVTSHSVYFLSSILSNVASSLTYVEEDGTAVQADITIEHHSKASTYEITLESTRHSAEASRDTFETVDDTEFIMQELDGIRTYTQSIDGERQQVPSTNDSLNVVSDFLTEKATAVFMKSPEIELISEYDIDPSLTMNVEDTVVDGSELD